MEEEKSFCHIGHIGLQGCGYILEAVCAGVEPLHTELEKVSVEKICWFIFVRTCSCKVSGALRRSCWAQRMETASPHICLNYLWPLSPRIHEA